MEIPPAIRRRYGEIELYLNDSLKLYNVLILSKTKEQSINQVCNSIAVWFHISYGSYIDLSVDELRKFFIFMFRTKLSIYWEEQNKNQILIIYNK